MSRVAHNILASLLLASCATSGGPVFRPCPHGGGVYLSAHTEEPMDPPPSTLPLSAYGAAPPGLRALSYPPVLVLVTVHNTKDFPIQASLKCGTNDALIIRRTVALAPLQETDISFPVQRKDFSIRFSCEIENWVSR